MKRIFSKKTILYTLILIIIAVLVVLILTMDNKSDDSRKISAADNDYPDFTTIESMEKLARGSELAKGSEQMPVYGNWKTFTEKDGLPSDKVYTVRIDGNRVLAGTHDGLAVYEKGKWRTYTTGDGLAHNGVVSIDVSVNTGDVWIGTLSGLSRWSGGKFETFNQFNSGMPNDLVYNVFCYGNDVWVATGGGAGHYNTFTKEWEIFTEQNAPMHEPWTYALSAGDGKVWIAAWGGGVIEYNTLTKQFRDYVDPDGFMEIDLQPDDGVIHDITTATSYADSILWVSTYFGMSRYDGKFWKGYFDHDSGLASNFINFLRAEGPVVFVCSDNGLSSFNGKTWVTYKKFDNSTDGQAIVKDGNTLVMEMPLSPSIAHNFTIGVDAEDDVLWVATSKGVCRGELLKN
ncbi:MAG: hypothetical protein A2V64_02825 [Bacteroidetes bacterium RBG_13_43_22]|nr:MAG: hypothetical protein A2V64_02825 [Bacteroidetes bacterium RBG_13_43_22]